MRPKVAIFFRGFWAVLGAPFRWLWRFLGRLGLAERKLLEATWRRLGVWGIVLRRALSWVLRLVWRPARWLGLTLWPPIRWLGQRIWRGVRWLAPVVWEELGRLGTAARRMLAIITWPLAVLVRWLWRVALYPVLSLLRDWVRQRWMVAGRKARSRWELWQARRRVLRREQRALAHSRPAGTSASHNRIRLMVAMGVLIIVLSYLVVRLAADGRLPAEAGPVTPEQTPTTRPTRSLPTTTPLPTPIPVTPAPTPDRLAVGGSVAFASRHNGHDDIYALAVGRREPFRLTDHPADDRDPVWSPDGLQLAFCSRRDGNWELYLLDMLSGETIRLTNHIAFDGNPNWSPDGQWLVFESYREENLDIYIVPAAGGEVIRLTSDPAPDYAPSWSPSGRHIAFISWRTGNPDIHLLPLDDARDEAAITISRTPDLLEDNPVWHPGGEYLAFDGRSGDQRLVFVQPMQNNLPSDQPFVVAQGREPAWSPSGNALLYAHDNAGRHYLLASAVNGWGAAPEVFVGDAMLHSPSWQAAALPPILTYAGDDLAGDPAPYLETIADPAEDSPAYTLVTLAELQVSGPYLNDRVDDSFEALRQRMIEEAGWDFLGTLDQMWEPMDTAPPPGLDGRSWNKAGRAFDIGRELNLGPQPLVEVVPEPGDCDAASGPCSGTETWWRVFVRAQRQDGSQGEPLRARPWNFQARYSGNASDYEAGGQPKSDIPAGYYVDLTQLAADYGWERVPSGRIWRTFFPAVLFWRFEKREGLTWEEAMLELYTHKELNEAFGGFAP